MNKLFLVQSRNARDMWNPPADWKTENSFNDLKSARSFEKTIQKDWTETQIVVNPQACK